MELCTYRLTDMRKDASTAKPRFKTVLPKPNFALTRLEKERQIQNIVRK